MNKKLLIALKLAFGLGILAFLLVKFDVKQVASTLSDLPLAYAFLTLAIYVVINLSGAIKVSVLLKPLGHKLKLWHLFKDYSLGFSYGQFVPGKIGEFSLVYFLKKRGVPLGASGPIVLIDKLAGFVILAAFALIGVWLYLNQYFLFFMILLLLGTLIVYLFLFTEKGRNFIKKFIWKKLTDSFGGFSATMAVLSKEKERLLIALLLSLMKWLLSGWILYLIFTFFQVPISYLQVMFVTTTASMISFIRTAAAWHVERGPSITISS